MRGGVIPLLLRSIQGPLCQPCADRSSCRFRPPKWAFRIPLTQKAIQMALDGDPMALRLCLDRLCPPRRDRPVSFPLPPITGAQGCC